MKSRMDAAARPTSTKTPATAPVLRKKLRSKRSKNDIILETMKAHDADLEPPSELSVGFNPTSVMVTMIPSEPVEVTVLVINDGVTVVLDPELSVVVTKMTLLKVVLSNKQKDNVSLL